MAAKLDPKSMAAAGAGRLKQLIQMQGDDEQRHDSSKDEPKEPHTGPKLEAAALEPAALPDFEAGFPPYSTGTAYPVGARMALPLELIDENPLNPRIFFSEKEMQSLFGSIAKSGQLTTIQVYPQEPNGRFKLKSGHRRCRTLRALGKTFAKVEVVEPIVEVLGAYKQARDINVQHKAQTHFDDAIRFQELLDGEHAKSQSALAISLNIPEAEVSKCLNIGRLPRECLELMAENVQYFGMTAAYLIYQYWRSNDERADVTLALIQRVLAGKFSVRQLDSLVKQGSQTTALKGKREFALSRAVISGEGRGALKAFEGKLTLNLEDLPDDKRDTLFRIIVQALEGAGLSIEAGVSSGQVT
jgi:ParB family transcriptional regulator, chromosome partitioning protein